VGEILWLQSKATIFYTQKTTKHGVKTTFCAQKTIAKNAMWLYFAVSEEVYKN